MVLTIWKPPFSQKTVWIAPLWSPSKLMASSFDLGLPRRSNASWRATLESIIGPSTSLIGSRKYLPMRVRVHNSVNGSKLVAEMTHTCLHEQCSRRGSQWAHSIAIDFRLAQLAPFQYCGINGRLLACKWKQTHSKNIVLSWRKIIRIVKFCSHFSYFKKVMFTEQPSAAPTPVSRRIFCACSKFGALNNALVMKCRANCL